ncbi:malate dehydrogenase [Acrasis kona]|uniref:Malic enzyme n=1 Tax=Acrasis kona TaxID=1008807 RepID=A0AAW2ZFG8_9EUKA
MIGHRCLKRCSTVVRSAQQLRFYPSEHTDYTPTAIFTTQTGYDVIHDPLMNKGTGFNRTEKDRLLLRGLLPPRSLDMKIQARRIMARYNTLTDDIDKYLFLVQLQDRNETLFYHVLASNIKDMAPIIYTPTVGKACQSFATIFQRARGMYFSAEDRGEMRAMVYNYPVEHVDVVVVTDGGRILGLGDLGANGMGIPIGKLSLYVAAGGINPGRVLPCMIDVGTNNENLLNDPFYLGINRKRITGDEYYEIVEEFMDAVTSRWPNVLIQFEDFTPDKAPKILDKYKNRFLTFNDDIQGTGSVIVSGVLNALRASNQSFSDLQNQRVVVAGAGAAGLGVVNAIANAMRKEGADDLTSLKNFYLCDKDGLITSARKVLTREQTPFAQVRDDMEEGLSLYETVKRVKPTILLGISGIGGLFKEETIREMSKHVDRPIIFPLSNPTSQSEATAEQIYTWTEGKAVFASGSPFAEVVLNGRTYPTSQGNNMFIFPGVGLGSIVAGSKRITSKMFHEASKALANSVPADRLQQGYIYPDVADIRSVTIEVAAAVALEAIEAGLADRSLRDQFHEENIDLKKYVAERMWEPNYKPIIYSKTK